jgi:SpoVK/Ycf46/Vps4 family AAA+-type ATPase
VNFVRISALDGFVYAVANSNFCYSIVRSQFPVLGDLLHLPLGEVERCFMKNSPLLLSGLFRCGCSAEMEVSESMRKLINTPCTAKRSLKDIVLEEKAEATLSREHFAHMADEYAYLASLLGMALKRRDRGVNILFYGPPGTGKTELAKTLCAEIKAELDPVSESSNDSGRKARLSDLETARALVSGDSKAVLLVDEAEDIFFTTLFGEGHAKLYLNRLLEKNATPVLWISNNVWRMDPACIRRFSYALHMETPPASARARIWKNELARNKISMSDTEIEGLAHNYVLPPAFTASAIRSARIVHDKDAIERTLQSLECAISGRPTLIKDKKRIVFNAALLNADTDLERLAGRVLQAGTTRFSLCLYGPPGTGKSEYARYLADRMGLEVLHKRASDLQSMWVGETEKNIANAFHEAHKEKKMLIFDEADSFLQERSAARNSWEVSQVNEMLTWMESHPLPFVCTTNLMEYLDRASLRRFTFKVRLDYLRPEQVRLAFRHFFSLDCFFSLRSLTPGDFCVVQKKASILGVDDPAELAAMLAREQEAKGVQQNARIGF